MVFLKPIGSYDMLTADIESEKSEDGPGREKPRLKSISRKKIISLQASVAPKNSASARERATDRCILENQRARQPWKKKRAPDAKKRVGQFESTYVSNPIKKFGQKVRARSTVDRG